MDLESRRFPRQERSHRTIERILDAAAHVFHHQGHAGATTNDIADLADVSIGSLYRYFPNKDALLVALMRRHIASATSSLATVMEELPADAEIEHVVSSVVEHLVSQHELDDLHVLVMHEAPRTHEVNRELTRAKEQMVGIASAMLCARIADEERRMLVARMVVATIDAAVHDVIIGEPRGPKRQAAIDLTVATALRIIEESINQRRKK